MCCAKLTNHFTEVKKLADDDCPLKMAISAAPHSKHKILSDYQFQLSTATSWLKSFKSTRRPKTASPSLSRVGSISTPVLFSSSQDNISTMSLTPTTTPPNELEISMPLSPEETRDLQQEGELKVKTANIDDVYGTMAPAQFDKMFEQLCDDLGFIDAVRQKIMSLPKERKLEMIRQNQMKTNGPRSSNQSPNNPQALSGSLDNLHRSMGHISPETVSTPEKENKGFLGALLRSKTLKEANGSSEDSGDKSPQFYIDRLNK